tara:strand:- start:16 stop:192 length:177 start_codon:yes stop_codon:yes gene_type:complete
VRQLQVHLFAVAAWNPGLQAEQGERRRDTPFWMRFKKILLQPKSSTTTGFNTEADDLT